LGAAFQEAAYGYLMDRSGPGPLEDGGLIAYGPRLSEVFRQCARQVAKLLRGAKVADVPVEQPTEFELIINLKTAQTLGVEIPPALLSRANTAIERDRDFRCWRILLQKSKIDQPQKSREN
jgi:ABC transporter substrate binding protein